MSRSMDNPLHWSVRVGSLFGIVIRLHLFFILGALLLIAQSLKNMEHVGIGAVAESVGVVAVLFAIVLVHEFGHCFGARRTGGEATEILMWPLGGLATVAPPHEPRAHLITALAGPMVNVILCAATATALILLHGGFGAVPWNPLNGFMPLDATVNLADPLQRWLRIVFTLSLMILLFNLLPIYPLDGGRVLHSLIWPRRNFIKATLIATFVGMVGAIVLGLAGLILEMHVLLLIAFFGYITCYFDRKNAKMLAEEGVGEFGYDFSQGYGAFDQEQEPRQKRPRFFERRSLARAEARRQRDEAQRERTRKRADSILAKVHQHGLDSLTPEERHVLEEETQRRRTVADE